MEEILRLKPYKLRYTEFTASALDFDNQQG